MPKILILRLNIKSFGDLALDAIFIRELPQDWWVIPVYPPLISLFGKRNFANKSFIDTVSKEIYEKFATPQVVRISIKFSFQIFYLFCLVVIRLAEYLGSKPLIISRFFNRLYGRNKLFEALSTPDLCPTFSGSSSQIDLGWWRADKFSDGLIKDLEESCGRVVVIHHRPESNGGTVQTSFSVFEQVIEDLLLDGFCVVRLKESVYAPSARLGRERYHELDVRKIKEEVQLVLIRNCSFFIGSSSGPVWVALYFGRPTLQINYADFLLNGPFLKWHFVTPMKMRSIESGDVLTCSKLMERGVGAHFFGPRTAEGVHFLPASSSEVLIAVRRFRKRLCDNEFAVDATDEEKQISKDRADFALAMTSDQLEQRHGVCTRWDVELNRIHITAKSHPNAFITVEQA